MSTSDPDRRAYPRYPATEGVRVYCRRSGTEEGPNLALALLDASQAGMRLFLSAPVDPAEELRLTLEVDDLAVPLRLSGVVRWAVDRDDGTCIAGVELEQLMGETALGFLTENPWA